METTSFALLFFLSRLSLGVCAFLCFHSPPVGGWSFLVCAASPDRCRQSFFIMYWRASSWVVGERSFDASKSKSKSQRCLIKVFLLPAETVMGSRRSFWYLWVKKERKKGNLLRHTFTVYKCDFGFLLENLPPPASCTAATSRRRDYALLHHRLLSLPPLLLGCCSNWTNQDPWLLVLLSGTSLLLTHRKSNSTRTSSFSLPPRRLSVLSLASNWDAKWRKNALLD